MIQRLLNTSKNMSFLLFGARGTGKSTWLQAHFREGEHLWIDLTNPQVERRYARRPEILIEEWQAYRKKDVETEPWIIVDEVQKIPTILDVAHVGIQRHKIKFALTGSSARKLRRGSANLLAGRAFSYRMHPLTVTELGDYFRLEEYLHWGGLPLLQSLSSNSDRQKYLASYVDTYLREEIQIEQLVRKIEPFRMFLDIVGQMNGEIINMAKIAKDAAIDPKSSERYFQILGDTLLGFFLPAYSESVRKSQKQHPKFYLFDIGVTRALRGELLLPLAPHTGSYRRCFEHFIVQQILALNDYFNTDYKLSYLRTKDDNEVDLVIQRPGKKPIFAEIKSTMTPENLILRGFLNLARDAQAEAWVICQAPHEFQLEDARIMPWKVACQELFLGSICIAS